MKLYFWQLFATSLIGIAVAELVRRLSRRRRSESAFDPDDPENWIGLNYVHERIMAQLDRQEARWKEIDDRLRFLLGVIGIVFAAGGGFMRNSLPTGPD